MALGVMWTSAKDFGRWPELLAVHVERVQRAAAAGQLYLASVDLRSRGLIAVGGLLGPDLAARVAAEVRAVRPGDAKRKDSLVANRAPESPARRAAAAMWRRIGPLWRGHLIEADRLFLRNTYLQHLVNEPGDGDIQKVLHCDTFFPALKFWYFPEPVGADDGPLVYVPGSPVLTPALLDWHRAQAESIAAGTVEPWRGAGHGEGSLRIGDGELAELGLEAEPVTVDADTLVIANVFGFHRRGDAPTRCDRVSVHGSIRISRPLDPGLPRVEPEGRLS